MQTTAVEQQPAPSFQAVNKPPNPTSVSSSESNDTNSANRSPGRFIPDSASEPRTPASPTTQLRLSLASSSFNTSYQTTNGEIMESPSPPTNPPVPCRPPGGNARGRAGTRRSIADGTESGDDSGGTGNRRSLSRQGSSQGRKKKKGQRFYCTGYGDCDLSFTRSEHLARHIRKHTGERPFQCHCGRTFSRLDNLRQHSSTVHADEDIPASSLAAQGTRYQRHISKSQLAKCRGKAPEKAHPLAGEHVKTPAVQEPEQQRQQEEDDEGEDASPFDSSLARQDASRSRPRPTPIRVPQQDLGTGPAFRNYRDNNTPPDSPVSAVGPSRREAAYYSERHTPYPAPRSAIASLTTPTSATFTNGHGSPLSPTPSPWAAASTAGISVVSSPVSSFPRRQSELGRTQARRLSVPGPARYTPISNSSFALPPSNLSSTPPSRNSIPPFPGPLVNPLLHRDSRRDSVNSVTDEEDEKAKRRRTWGPDSGSNYRTPLPRDVLSPMTGTFAQASISGSSTEYNGSSPSSSPSSSFSTTSNQQNVQASSPFPPLKINQFPQNNTTLPGIRDILQDVGPDFSKRMPRPRAASSATEYSVPESSKRGSLRSPFIPSHSRSSSSGGLSSAPFYEPSERPVSSYGRRDSTSRPSSSLSQLNFQFPRRDTLPDSPSKGPTRSDETAAPFRGNHMRISGVHGHSRSHSYDTPRQYAGLTSNSNTASPFNVSSPLTQKRAFLNWRTTVSSTVHWEGGSNQPRSGSNGLEARAVEMPRTSANSLPGDPIGNGEHIEKSERAIVPSRLTFMYTLEDNLDRGVQQQQANSNLPFEKAPTSTNTAQSNVSAPADKSGLTTGANDSIPRMEEALGVLASAANLVSIQEKRRHEPYTKAVGFNYTSDNPSSQYQ